MSTLSARQCQDSLTVLSVVPQVARWPCSTDPTRAVPVMLGAVISGMVHCATVTGSDDTAAVLKHVFVAVTFATSCLPTKVGEGTKDVASSRFGSGDPLDVHRMEVVVGVGIHGPGSRVTAPATLTSPPITGAPTDVKSWVAGVKSTLTVAPVGPAEETWMLRSPDPLVQVSP